MKGKKVDFGMRCTKCNHKISESQLNGKNGEQTVRSGVCYHCRVGYEWSGLLVLHLNPEFTNYRQSIEFTGDSYSPLHHLIGE